MLTVHHLGHSQSERIVWLCEELGIAYELKHYTRDAVTRLAPPELGAIHPLRNAPVITDGELVLAESGAIVEYIIERHGGGRLKLPPDHPDYAQYLYWFHFANGNLQTHLGRCMILHRLDLPAGNAVADSVVARLHRSLALMDGRLATVPWLAGDAFTAAEIMSVFSLTTMREFLPLDLAPYPGIRAWLERVGAREAYRRAMQKGDPDMVPMLP